MLDDDVLNGDSACRTRGHRLAVRSDPHRAVVRDVDWRLGDAALTMQQRLAEGADRFSGCGVDDRVAVIEDDRPIADTSHEIGGVRDEEDRPSLALEAGD